MTPQQRIKSLVMAGLVMLLIMPLAEATEIVAEGEYVGGEKHGYWIEMRGDGTVWKGLYVHGKKHGKWVGRHDSAGGEGSTVWEGQYVNDKRHGKWTAKFPSGSVTEGSYVDGKEHGQWILKYPDGSVSVSDNASMVFYLEEVHGQWMIIFPDGKVEKSSYVNGELQE